ncbi:m-AAA protease-interacting protein 1, mitochondrial isoform X2 [Synchiropus splendidus]|uniref:m-AAA protease-interacting protein 1, mitochondrial isoform X2 n=1 Tax=Synchiropus splendidus TaxID=270530 RepID=UPI00237E8E7B|nr:m-AAA protease-interacting protein 1, mitochondrial isoform X2 [Synchiropus splendidus]
MALQVSRFYKLPSTFGVTRLLLQDTLARSRSSRRHLPVTSIAAAVRPYSSNRRDQKPNQKVVVVGLTNPFIWIRTRIYYFLIRAYFDAEFSIEEFTEGAKQLIGKLEEKCNLLPSNYKSALYAEPEEIMFTTPSDVGIYYDDDGRKFVSILMRFWYLTSARLPDDSLEGTKIFKVAIGNVEGETKRLLTANYEFQREFTKGVEPDWTITRIEHSKLLD